MLEYKYISKLQQRLDISEDKNKLFYAFFKKNQDTMIISIKKGLLLARESIL